jgi:hypothetical protein
MTLRRLTVALALVCGLCVWAFARTADGPNSCAEPIRVENGDGSGNHDEAEARYRHSQSNHWRHVAVGNNSYCR